MRVEVSTSHLHQYNLGDLIGTLRRIRYTGKLQRGDYAELAAAEDLLEAIETDCSLLSECTVTLVGNEPLFDDIDEGETFHVTVQV